MKDSQSNAVKCLNASSSGKRFVFKSFSQRVEEIDIDVFRSLEPVKSEPSQASSFFLETLLNWRELNTAEDFISFFVEMVPLVQTLPLILLHKEKIFSELVKRLHMGSKLSLEPILMLIAALAKDLSEEFLPFLPGLIDSLTKLLANGGDRDPEVLEQVFKSWSHILMNLRKYLVKDVVHVLRITRCLRFFPKAYVQEFMAEAISFLLRNSSRIQLLKGVRKIMYEVAKNPSHVRKTAVASLLSFSMKGTSSRLHSRAGQVFRMLIAKSAFNIRDKFPHGSEAVLEVITGAIRRLCEEVDHKDLNLVFNCLFEEIASCFCDSSLEHLKYLLDLLTFTIHNTKKSKIFDCQVMLECVKLLIQAHFLPSDKLWAEESSMEAVNKMLKLMLCLLDVPHISDNMASTLLLYAPSFKLGNSSLLTFVRELLQKEPHIVDRFSSFFLSSMNDLIDSSPHEVLFLMLTFFERQGKLPEDSINGVSGDKICRFFEETLCYWAKLISEFSVDSDQLDRQVIESELVKLWGILSCYHHLQCHLEKSSTLRTLIDALDRLLDIKAGFAYTTWQSLLGAALVTYHKLLMVGNAGLLEAATFLRLAKRHKSSSQVVSAVAEFLDSVLGSTGEASIVEELGSQEAVKNALEIFTASLSHSDKSIRVSTLRILSHYALPQRQPSSIQERPHKKLKTEESGALNEDVQCSKVIELLLSIELTPLSISTSRKVLILLSRLQTDLMSGKICDEYIPLLLKGIIGILHNRFGHLWEPTMECLSVLIGKHKELVWDQFIEFFRTYQSKYVSSGYPLMISSGQSTKPMTLYDWFNLFLAPNCDSTPCTTVITLLLQSLQKVPEVAESRSRQLVPLFLTFLGYSLDDTLSVGVFDYHKCKGKEWRIILKEWLDLLRLMRNSRSLYRSEVLKEVLIGRLLDEIDPDIQLKVLDCLLNWRDDFLVPYELHLKNLISSKNLREELTTWVVAKESQYIQAGHRGHLIPLIIRLLTPKVRTLKALASRKHAGVNHRKAVLCFLSQLDAEELQLFFSLLLKPLIANCLPNEHFDFEIESSFGRCGDSSRPFVLEKCSTSAIADLSWKKRYGFLHVVEDILRTFDGGRIEPFLNSLMRIVGWILENCMLNLTAAYGKDSATIEDSTTSGLKVSEIIDMKPNSALMNASVKQFKDLRSLCLKVISFVLNKYDHHDFGSDFWGIFFKSVKPLIDSFREEGSSSEKPSSLFSCFLAMSRSPVFVSLLDREAHLVPTILEILTVRTASDAIISSVLNFVENLLNLDNDLGHQEDNPLRRVLLPYIGALVHSLHGHIQFHREFKRKSTIEQEKTVLRILKLLVTYVKSPSLAEQLIEILIPVFKKKPINPDDCLEGLQVMKGVLPFLGDKSSGRVLNVIHPLLLTSGLQTRCCICDIVDSLALHCPPLKFLARLLRELNAISSSEVGELDYDTRVDAYESIQPDLFWSLTEDHALIILSHCVYDLSSGEIIFRQSASRSLSSFIQFASQILNENRENCEGMLLHDGAQKIPMHMELETSNNFGSWTKASILRMVKRVLLRNMGEAMNKDISVQKEWIILFRDMVYNLQGISVLNSFGGLCSEDPDHDFFNNILHLQIHRRARALSCFRNVISASNFAESIVVKIFVPLLFNMLFDVKDGKGEHLRNACLDTLASICGQLPWKSYQKILMRCFWEMSLKPDKQKMFIRLICAILDKFHFSNANSNQALGDGHTERLNSGTVEGNSQTTLSSSYPGSNTPSDIQVCLQKAVLPQIQKLLASDSEKVNVNISLAALKILKLLPIDALESQLPSIIHQISNFLKNHLESIRDEARNALAACLNELGLGYLHFIVKVLRAILKRGYELHVLGYTLNFILARTLRNTRSGELDYCLEELLLVTEDDILGDVGEEKEVDKISSKMKETRKSKSFETLKLIAESITFKTHSLKLLSPIFARLQKHVTPKSKAKLEMMLQHIASGIQCNPSVNPVELFVFVYGLIEDSISEKDSQAKHAVATVTNHKTTWGVVERKTMQRGDHRPQSSHIITVFAIGVLHSCLMKTELDETDERLLSMLDPFVKLLGDCLNSRYEDILSATFKCLGPLIRLPLPSLEAQADKIKISLLDVAQKFGNASSPVMQSCLKLLIVLLDNTRITLSDDQLHMLIQSPLFVDIQTNPSPVALSLLKSIIGRRLGAAEVYDIVMRVAELMVTTQVEPIRKKCGKVLLQFLLDYQLSDKRLQQHLDFLLTNLRYGHASGRAAVLEMLHAVIRKFPKSIVDNQAQTFYLHLVVALANEHDKKVRAIVSNTIKELIHRTGQHGLNSILEYSLSWYMGEKQNLWSAAAQVLGLLVEVLKKGINKHLDSILHIAKRILESSIDVVTDEGHDFSAEPAIPFWNEAYYSLAMLEELLRHSPELHLDRKLEDIWEIICKLLLHPHVSLRKISSRLVALYFVAASEASGHDNENLNQKSLFLVKPSRLFAIAVSSVKQLQAQIPDDATSNVITENFVFSVCGLHSFARERKSPPLHETWSNLDLREQATLLGAFELLGSKKARTMLLLSTTNRNSSGGISLTDQDGNEDLQSLLVAPLLSRMGKIAMQMDEVQMKICFNAFRKITSQIGSESNDYASHILLPLYKVCEGFAGKDIGDGMKRLAEEVRDSIRKVLGVDNFIKTYNLIRKNLKAKRDKRRQEEKLLAVVNPECHAKRKLRNASKHRANKKRKIMSMKLGRWRR